MPVIRREGRDPVRWKKNGGEMVRSVPRRRMRGTNGLRQKHGWGNRTRRDTRVAGRHPGFRVRPRRHDLGRARLAAGCRGAGRRASRARSVPVVFASNSLAAWGRDPGRAADRAGDRRAPRPTSSRPSTWSATRSFAGWARSGSCRWAPASWSSSWRRAGTRSSRSTTGRGPRRWSWATTRLSTSTGSAPASRAVAAGAAFFAVNMDARFPGRARTSSTPAAAPWPRRWPWRRGVRPIAIGKPHAPLFDVASTDWAATRQAAMVGDNLPSDIVGGRAAGMFTVWLDPLEHPLVPPEVDLRVGGLVEMLRLWRSPQDPSHRGCQFLASGTSTCPLGDWPPARGRVNVAPWFRRKHQHGVIDATTGVLRMRPRSRSGTDSFLFLTKLDEVLEKKSEVFLV